MKVCVIIFTVLMVFQAITCEKAVSKLLRKLIVPKLNEKCKKIKCATVDDPQCVRMRRHDLSFTIHIIATNKCEMEYMKCHDDVEAKIVPMKYCSHTAETAGKKKNKPGKAHVRVKRRVKAVYRPFQRQPEPHNTTEQPRTGFKDNNNKTKHHKLKKSTNNSKKLSLQRKKEDSNVISKDNDNQSTMKGHGAGHHVRQSLGYPFIFESESDSDWEHNERKKIKKGLAGHLLDVEDENSMQQFGPKAFIKPSAKDLKGITKPQSLSHPVEIIDWGNLNQELGTEFPMLSGEAGNFSKESFIAADKEQYEKMCPTVCPSRDVMVCGRCQHGIYKTFMSVCHLRMFRCSHAAETMQLVARYPCVLSAPYVSDTGTQFRGRIKEPGDDDKILRFIMCRDQHKLGTDEKPPVTFLLLIQMGYILAKAIENPRSCNDSPENDPRLKRSDEKEIHFDSEDTAGKDFDDVAIRKTFSKPNNDNNHDITNNDNENSNEFASNSNTLPQKFPLVNNATKFPANVEERDIVTDRLTTTKDAPLQQPVYYQPIDPKYLIISGLSLPKPTKNITNASKSEDPVNIDVKETIATPINYSNLIKAMNVSNRDEENDNVRKKVIINDADTDTDVSNIRELREHLLDHLLDYFLNIIKEENYIRNDTRKKNGKDRMKVEEKLRNYYDPHHLDMFFDDDNDDDDDSDDDDYYDNNLDNFYNRRSNDSEEDLLDNVKNKELKKENITNFDPHNTLADEVDQNTPEAYTSPEYLQNEALNLKQNLNGESFKVNSSTPSSITSKYVNLIKQENDLSNTLLNITEKPGEAFDSNVNIITTTERSISNEALNEKAAEIDTDLLKYSREAVSDRIEYVYDNGALIVNEYTSFEDYIDSDEFEVVKNVTVHENNRNPIVITTENGRTKNALGKEKHIANVTLNETYNNKNNSQIRNNTTTSKDIASERQDKLNELAILDLPNKNINDNSPCNEENLAQSKNKHSLKNSKQGIKRKLRNNKNCGKLVNKNNKLINKKSKKHNCRKSIILNLNINLI